MASSKEFETNIQLRRIFTIIRILISNRYPAKMSDIKKSLTDRDVPLPSDKTLGRDMKEIESLGYSIHLGIGKGYFLQNKEEIAGLFFYDEDVQALQMSRALFGYFEGTRLKEYVDEAITQITGAKSNLSTKRLDELEDKFMVHFGQHRDLSKQTDVVDAIIAATNSNTQLRIGYKRPNGFEDAGIIEPYRLVLYKDTLYVLARKVTSE